MGNQPEQALIIISDGTSDDGASDGENLRRLATSPINLTALETQPWKEPIECKHKGMILVLKTRKQRSAPDEEAIKLLSTYHPTGSEERLQQLEWILDERLAPYGFDDDQDSRSGPDTTVDARERAAKDIFYEARYIDNPPVWWTSKNRYITYED